MNEQLKKLAAEIEQIRGEWKGKEGEMPPAVEEKLDRALADYDALTARIGKMQRAEAIDKALSAPSEETRQMTSAIAGQTGASKGLVEDAMREIRDAFRGALISGTSKDAEGYRSAWRKHGGLLKTHALQIDDYIGGGALVAPPAFVAEVIQAADNATFARQLSRVFPVGPGMGLGAPTLDNDIADTGRVSELGSAPESEPEFGNRLLVPKPYKRLVRVGWRFLEAARIDLESYIAGRVGYKTAVFVEREWMTGSSGDEMLGIFTGSSFGIPTTRDYDTAATTTIAADDVIDLFYTLKQPYQQRASWVIHRDNVGRIRKLKSGASGDYVWNPLGTNSQAIVGASPGTILGRPYYMSEYAPNGTTAGSYWAIVGDFNYYWIAEEDRIRMTVLRERYAETSQIGYLAEGANDGMPVLGEAFSRGKLKA